MVTVIEADYRMTFVRNKKKSYGESVLAILYKSKFIQYQEELLDCKVIHWGQGTQMCIFYILGIEDRRRGCASFAQVSFHVLSAVC
jgi:hypothetical protein